MMSDQGARGDHERGQVLVLFVLGVVAITAMVAFVVDGGNAFAQERHTQNGTDAAALSGTTVLAERLGGGSPSDADVLAAITATATAMEVAVDRADYTDISGQPIGVSVGSIGAGPPPAGAAGVAVTGRRPFGTYFARAIGMDEFTAVTDAIAITGYTAGPKYGLIPVTPPINVLTCDGQNRPDFSLDDEGQPFPWQHDVLYKIPLCHSAPGNVGWIDWTPPSGGDSELADCIRDPLTTTGCNEGVTVPSWMYVAQTGNTNSTPVEGALRTWDGEVVYVPLFDDTCNEDPDPDDTDPNAECPGGPGTGQQHWYHFVGVGDFRLCKTGLTAPNGGANGGVCTDHGAYLTGNNLAECEDQGNGATSCLVGWFEPVEFTNRAVLPIAPDFPSPTDYIGIQLIG